MFDDNNPRASIKKQMECDCSACEKTFLKLVNNVRGAMKDWAVYMSQDGQPQLACFHATMRLIETLIGNTAVELMDQRHGLLRSKMFLEHVRDRAMEALEAYGEDSEQ